MRGKAAWGLPGGLINTSLFLLRGCVWAQAKKKKKILPVGSGGGDTVKHDASIFVRVFLVGGGVRVHLASRTGLWENVV